MRNFTRDISTRMVLAGTLIGASFLSAYFISSSANQSTLFWSARINLIAGSSISAHDLVAVPATLNGIGDKYLAKKTSIVGGMLVRGVKKGELLPISSLDPDRNHFDHVSLPISVQRTDLPKDLLEGELVNVYHVGDPNQTSTIILPSLVLSRVYVRGIDKTGANMGGSQTLTLSTPATEVMGVLKATSAGRLVIIRLNG